MFISLKIGSIEITFKELIDGMFFGNNEGNMAGDDCRLADYAATVRRPAGKGRGNDIKIFKYISLFWA